MLRGRSAVKVALAALACVAVASWSGVLSVANAAPSTNSAGAGGAASAPSGAENGLGAWKRPGGATVRALSEAKSGSAACAAREAVLRRVAEGGGATPHGSHAPLTTDPWADIVEPVATALDQAQAEKEATTPPPGGMRPQTRRPDTDGEALRRANRMLDVVAELAGEDPAVADRVDRTDLDAVLAATASLESTLAACGDDLYPTWDEVLEAVARHTPAFAFVAAGADVPAGAPLSASPGLGGIARALGGDDAASRAARNSLWGIIADPLEHARDAAQRAFEEFGIEAKAHSPEKEDAGAIKGTNVGESGVLLADTAVCMHHAKGKLYGTRDAAGTFVPTERPWLRPLAADVDRLEKIIVPCTTLQTMSEAHGILRFDALVADGGGQDYEILTSLPPRTPSLVRFYHGTMKLQTQTSARHRLEKLGYSVRFSDDGYAWAWLVNPSKQVGEARRPAWVRELLPQGVARVEAPTPVDGSLPEGPLITGAGRDGGDFVSARQFWYGCVYHVVFDQARAVEDIQLELGALFRGGNELIIDGVLDPADAPWDASAPPGPAYPSLAGWQKRVLNFTKVATVSVDDEGRTSTTMRTADEAAIAPLVTRLRFRSTFPIVKEQGRPVDTEARPEISPGPLHIRSLRVEFAEESAEGATDGHATEL